MIVKTAFGDRWPSGHPNLSGGLGARSASALSPLVAAGSHDLLWDAQRRGQSLDGVGPGTNRGKGWVHYPPEGLRLGSPCR